MQRTVFKKNTPLAICLDFDGTITEMDVVDGILVHFTDELEWMAYETEWNEGRIGSDVCLAKQLELVKMSRQELRDYLKTIRLDVGFRSLKRYCDASNIPMAVVSDGFDYFIKEIFKIHHVGRMKFCANHLKLRRSQLIPEFPHKSANCHRCANCKRGFLRQARSHVKHLVFVGDGQSDICAVNEADTVFAKGALAEYCERYDKPFVSFQTLEDVLNKMPDIYEKIATKADLHESCAQAA